MRIVKGWSNNIYCALSKVGRTIYIVRPTFDNTHASAICIVRPTLDNAHARATGKHTYMNWLFHGSLS